MSFDRFLALTLLLVGVTPLADGLNSVRRMSSFVVVSEGEVITDDLTAVAEELRIEGRVEGDVLVLADRLIITGSVAGDVLGFARSADIRGVVSGSVRLAGGRVDVTGLVEEDVTTAVLSLRIPGSVQRDVYAFGGALEIGGTVGRDVAGRIWRRVLLSGTVGRDLEPVTPELRLLEGAVVTGTVVVWPGTDVTIAETAEVGSVARRTSQGGVLQVRAAFLMIRVILAVVFVLAGLLAFWLFPRSLQRATSQVESRPVASALWGLLVVAIPVVLAVTAIAVAAFAPIVVAAPLLGVLLPITLLAGALSVLFWMVAAVPALTVAGGWALRRRGSPVAWFAVAGVVWAVVLNLPIVGSFAAVAVVVFGAGGLALGAWQARGDPSWAFSSSGDSQTADGQGDAGAS